MFTYMNIGIYPLGIRFIFLNQYLAEFPQTFLCDRVSLHSPSWFRACYVDQAGSNFQRSICLYLAAPVPAFQVRGRGLKSAQHHAGISFFLRTGSYPRLALNSDLSSSISTSCWDYRHVPLCGL